MPSGNSGHSFSSGRKTNKPAFMQQGRCCVGADRAEQEYRFEIQGHSSKRSPDMSDERLN